MALGWRHTPAGSDWGGVAERRVALPGDRDLAAPGAVRMCAQKGTGAQRQEVRGLGGRKEAQGGQERDSGMVTFPSRRTG